LFAKMMQLSGGENQTISLVLMIALQPFFTQTVTKTDEYMTDRQTYRRVQ